MLDREAFKRAAMRAIAETEGEGGIGTLSEKVMHRTLKLYYEPDVSYHEVECLGSVADILNGTEIIEIQRSSLSYLLPKLKRFLPSYNVTVVHPIIAVKRIKWLDKATGEITSSGRKTAGKRIYDVAFELYKIAPFLTNARLTVRLPLLDCDVYKTRETRRGRSTSSRVEAIPIDIIDEIVLSTPRDYLVFLPDSLPDAFTASDFNRAIKSRSRYSYYSLRLLSELELLTRVKEGRGYRYYRTNK